MKAVSDIEGYGSGSSARVDAPPPRVPQEPFLGGKIVRVLEPHPIARDMQAEPGFAQGAPLSVEQAIATQGEGGE